MGSWESGETRGISSAWARKPGLPDTELAGIKGFSLCRGRGNAKISFLVVLSTTSIQDSSSQLCFSASPKSQHLSLDARCLSSKCASPLTKLVPPSPHKTVSRRRWLVLLLGASCTLATSWASIYTEKAPREHLSRSHPRGPSPWWGLLVLLEPSSYTDNSRWSICHPPLPVLFKAIAFHVDLFTFIQLYISSLPTSSHRIQMGLGTWHEIQGNLFF